MAVLKALLTRSHTVLQGEYEKKCLGLFSYLLPKPANLIGNKIYTKHLNYSVDFHGSSFYAQHLQKIPEIRWYNLKELLL